MESMTQLIEELEKVQREIQEEGEINGNETIHVEWSDKLKEIIDVLKFIGD